MTNYIKPDLKIDYFEKEAVLTNSLTGTGDTYEEWVAKNPGATQKEYKIQHFSQTIKFNF